jgi:hypothetical protein
VKYLNRRGAGGFIPFVVRPPWRAQVVVLLSFNTYQAYNSWGGASLYTLGDGTVSSVAVTFWRPYTDDIIYGHFMSLDMPLIWFLERWGYPVEYATDVDFHIEDDLGAEARVVVFSGHSEYWSGPMRDNAERLVSSGVGLAFLGANDSFWQVRYAVEGTRNAMRTMICFKTSHDPLVSNRELATVLFRDHYIGRPENSLMGIMHPLYMSTRQFAPLIVKAANESLFAGTGLGQGDSTTAIGGWEGDRIEDNGLTPSNLIVLFESPYITKDGKTDLMHTTVYRGSGGAQVFAAGTVSWNKALRPEGRPFADVRLQRFTRNLLDSFLNSP